MTFDTVLGSPRSRPQPRIDAGGGSRLALANRFELILALPTWSRRDSFGPRKYGHHKSDSLLRLIGRQGRRQTAGLMLTDKVMQWCFLRAQHVADVPTFLQVRASPSIHEQTTCTAFAIDGFARWPNRSRNRQRSLAPSNLFYSHRCKFSAEPCLYRAVLDQLGEWKAGLAYPLSASRFWTIGFSIL